MRNNAILFEWYLGDVGLRKTKVMGIQTEGNTDITILSLLFFRLIFFKKSTKFFEFLSEYTSSGFSLDWHPKVRLQANIASRKERAYWKKRFSGDIDAYQKLYHEMSRKNSKLEEEIRVLKKCIQILKDDDEEKKCKEET